MKFVSAIFAAAAIGVAAAQEPIPDTSDECNQCKSTLDELQITWTNETTVQEIVSKIGDCTMHFCQHFAEVLCS